MSRTNITGLCRFTLIWGFAFCSMVSCSSITNHPEDVIQQIISMQSVNIPDSVDQLILVFNENPDNSQAKLFTFQKDKSEWSSVSGPAPAGVGENGFATHSKKLEGDGKTPSGLFRLGVLFTYENQVDTKMPFIQSSSDDKWIDDPESEDYNRHVRGETSAKSYEKLKLASDYYKFCMVIEYNTNPVVKGKGSAIFLHLRVSDYETTAGCVAIAESEMLRILKWLDPDKHPMILMGNSRKLIESNFVLAK